MRIFGKIIFIFALILLAGYVLLTQTTYLDFIKTWPLIGDRVCCINDETSDWKAYRNDEYGFELKYPNNLIPHSPGFCGICDFSVDFLTSEQEDIINSKRPEMVGYNLSFFIYKDEPNNTLLNWIGNQKTEEFKVNNARGYKSYIIGAYSSPDNLNVAYFEKNRKIYSIHTDTESYLDQVLSTFKFIK